MNMEIDPDFLEEDFLVRPYEDLAKKCQNILDLFSPGKPEKISSLLHLTTTKVVICLWSEKYIQDLILQTYASSLREKMRILSDTSMQEAWRKIESAVISNLYKLQLPCNVEQNALNIVQPVGAQIKFWVDFHHELLFSKFPSSFCWTSKGQIDFVKTVRQLLADSSYSKYEHFSLACTYCLEKEIKALWPHVKNTSTDMFPSISSNIIHYWRCLLPGDTSSISLNVPLKTAPERSFLRAIRYASEAAVKYLVEQLDQDKKSGFISLQLIHIMSTTILHGPEVFVHLFPLMNEKDQVRWLDKNAYILVECFLQWPWLEYFVPLAKLLCSVLDSIDYVKLIQNISGNIDEFPNCHSYKQVFKEFWCSSPVVFKECIIDRCINGQVLGVLFLCGNETGAELIFEEVSMQQRTQMMLSNNGISICHNLISRKKWKGLEMLIAKCIPNKDYYLSFQKSFFNHVLPKYVTEDDLDNFSSFSVNMCEKYFSAHEK